MLLLGIILPPIILFLFFLLSKNVSWNKGCGALFECGFTSYFFSRFSFSNHYFIIGLVFLFLDIELCIIFPFFNQSYSSRVSGIIVFLFVRILLIGLLGEWARGALDWAYWAWNFGLHPNQGRPVSYHLNFELKNKKLPAKVWRSIHCYWVG